MTPQALPVLHRWLTLLLALLLALGPFLHSHFGTSHETGFHIDGVHAVHALAPSAATGMQSTDEDSPALGVATSRPQAENEIAIDPGWALLLLILPLLPLLPQAQPHSAPAHRRPFRRYRAGLPPPCLAPPAV